MTDEKLDFSGVPYLFDQSGRIYVTNNKVYRLIEDKATIKNYKNLLSSPHLEDLFAVGLIRTKIDESLSTTELLVLEHEKIPFILHPCEYTNQMFWSAAVMFIKLNLELTKLGFVTHDSHPWNITFIGNRPVFYDFGSIVRREKISKSWLNEFFTYYIVPIWLANLSKRTYNFSKEYRRENGTGFGIRFFKFQKLRKLLFRKFWRTSNFRYNPKILFNDILSWLQKHQPLNARPEYWSNYYELSDPDYTRPKSIKQNFVFKILSDNKPHKVLDLASNKGYYSFMAAHLGAKVMAFDYEEELVNHLFENCPYEDLVTMAQMNFERPTPALGPGFYSENSFLRYKSDIVLALGLIHHICITQQVPVYLFCQTCAKYASKGLILEFVDPNDKHVVNWKKPIPKDYSIIKISDYLKDKFPNFLVSEIENEDGLNRTYLYYY